MTLQAITTKGAPDPVGPYSQAIAVDGFVFLSGQIGLDPATSQLVEGGIEAQTERVLRSLSNVLDAAGLTWADVVKTTILLADIGDYGTVNTIYGRAVGDPAPARATFAVGALPRGALVEIEAIARRPSAQGS